METGEQYKFSAPENLLKRRVIRDDCGQDM